jgi:hypothetical protein
MVRRAAEERRGGVVEADDVGATAGCHGEAELTAAGGVAGWVRGQTDRPFDSMRAGRRGTGKNRLER